MMEADCRLLRVEKLAGYSARETSPSATRLRRAKAFPRYKSRVLNVSPSPRSRSRSRGAGSVESVFEGPMKSNDPLVRSFSSYRIERFHETRLVRIAQTTAADTADTTPPLPIIIMDNSAEQSGESLPVLLRIARLKSVPARHRD